MTKKNKGEMYPELTKLRDDIDTANNFIDYFLEIGIPPEISFNNWLYESSLDKLNSNDVMKPKIISAFPSFMKRSIAYDESIIKHCFPNGYKILESNDKPVPEIFSFTLDNNFFSIQYPQKYLSCIIFYESLENYYNLYTEYKKVAKSEVNNLKPSEKLKNLYIPKCLMLISLHPFFGEFESILARIYEYYSPKETGVDIPLDKIIENLIIEIPVPPRGIFHVKYLLFNEEREINQSLMNDLPLINIDLKNLFDIFTVEQIIDIYKYIILECRILFFSSNISLLNLFLYGLVSLLYPFQYQYQIVTILPSENFETIESITPFLAGINEAYTANFFEDKDLCLCETIVLVDIDEKKIYKKEGEGSEDSFNSGSTKSSKKKEEEICPEFPKGCRKSLEKSLSSHISQYKKNKIKRGSVDLKKKNNDENTNNSTSSKLIEIKEIDFEFNKTINNDFFLFNCNLLQNYNKFLNDDFYSSKGQPDLQNLFKLKDFLTTVNNSDKEFYTKFITETQIFGDFLYKRMIPKDSDERLQILPFEEKINEMTSSYFNKVSPSIFTTSQEYTFVNNFIVPKQRDLMKFEIDYLSSHNLIKYGIVIEKQPKDKVTNAPNNGESNNSPSVSSQEIKFKFPLFPLLTSEIFFLKNINEYFIPSVLTDEIKTINDDIVSKTNLGNIHYQMTDMSNYVYLCWMMLWAMSLWYVDDENEKEIKFQELMSVLRKVEHNEMEVYNLLMDALSKYGNDIMVFELYELIIEKKIPPSQMIRDIVMKVVDKKKFKNLSEKNFLAALRETKEQKLRMKKKQKIDKSKFKNRSLKSKYDINVAGTDVYFNAYDQCVNCSQVIDLEKAATNYSEMKRDILWFSCPGCNTLMIPKITIRFGKEMNKSGRLELNTSTIDSVVLFSPQYLKINISNMLVKEYGTKLDIEEFKLKYSSLFWNAIWYSKLKDLDYSIFLPYEGVLDLTILKKLKSNLSSSFASFSNFNKKIETKKDVNIRVCKGLSNVNIIQDNDSK